VRGLIATLGLLPQKKGVLWALLDKEHVKEKKGFFIPNPMFTGSFITYYSLYFLYHHPKLRYGVLDIGRHCQAVPLIDHKLVTCP
jgi:hypothetical protein